MIHDLEKVSKAITESARKTDELEITKLLKEHLKDIKINLGDLVKDKITGFEGIAYARHIYLYGCIRFSLQSRNLHDGKPLAIETFDEEQLEVVQSGILAPTILNIAESIVKKSSAIIKDNR